MSKFKDKEDREWTLEVTMGSASQVEQDAGVDLLTFIEDQAGWNNRTLFRVVGSLCAGQIAERGLDARSFADGFDGPALERASMALGEALLFFSQPSRIARAALPKMRQVIDGLHEKAARAIEAQDFSSWAGPSPGSAGSTPAP